jgi:glycerol-3-phosphate dehydrogenase
MYIVGAFGSAFAQDFVIKGGGVCFHGIDMYKVHEKIMKRTNDKRERKKSLKKIT